MESTVAGQTVDEMTQITEEAVCGAERHWADVSERTLTGRRLTPMIVYPRGCRAAVGQEQQPLGQRR